MGENKPTRKREKPVKATKAKVKLPADLQAMSDEVDKVYGEGLMTIGEKGRKCNRIPTGNFLLDLALLGGIPEGFNTMMYGYESSGKTTTSLKAIAGYQAKYPKEWCVMVDAEGMYDPIWAAKLGVDLDRLLVSSPDYGELAVDLIEDFITKKSVGLILVDSVPAMVPMKVVENASEDDTMAALARLMGKMCSKVTMAKNKMRRQGHEPTFIYTNQFRGKVGFVMGDPRSLPGGFQINHIPTTKIEMKKIKVHEGVDANGLPITESNEHAFKISKIKHGQSIMEGVYRMNLNSDNEHGLVEGETDDLGTVATYGKKMGFIRGGGQSWRIFTEDLEAKSERTGKPAVFTKHKSLNGIKDWLADNPIELLTLKKSIIAAQRHSRNVGMLPPDGFLLSRQGRVVTLESIKDIK